MHEFIKEHSKLTQNKICGAQGATAGDQLRGEQVYSTTKSAMWVKKPMDRLIKCWIDWMSDMERLRMRKHAGGTGAEPIVTPQKSGGKTTAAYRADTFRQTGDRRNKGPSAEEKVNSSIISPPPRTNSRGEFQEAWLSLLSKEDENLSQIVEQTCKISLSEKANLSEENYSEELSNPLTWNECLEKFDDIDWETELKFKLSRESHEWRTFSFSILLGCVQTHLKKEEAAATFDSCEKLLEENKNDKFFVDILDGLEHILSSSRLILFRKTGSKEAEEKILPRMKYFGELNKVSQAAVYSMKGYILCLFGYEAKLEALKYARLAIELDPDDLGLRRGAWYYHAGKILAQIRHTKSFCEMPSDEEIRFLEKSVEIDPFLVHLSFLAETYREIVKASRRLPYPEREPEFHYQILLKKAKRMYGICVHDKTASVAVLTRCGMGLIKLPRHLKDVELAKEAFQRAMNSGSRRATIGMGYLFDWCLGDYKEALYYFEKAYSKNAVKAGVEIIKMKYKIDRKYNPLEDCDKYIKDLERMLEARQKYELTIAYCMIKAEYLLVERKDLLAAVGEWKIAMNQHYDSKYLWDSKRFFASNSHLKLSNLICMEINKALEQRRFVGIDEIYLKETLEKFPQQCKD